MVRVYKHLSLLPALGVVVVVSIGFSVAQQTPSSASTKNSAAVGRNMYNSSCAACHGLDGHGSDKAPNIAAGSEVKNFSDAQLSDVISNGLPGTGMPAFHTLSATQVRALVLYLRSLQGKGSARALPGVAARGKEIFFGKGECSSCHTISGQGGFLGPDLSAYVATSSPEVIREEIVRPQRNPRHGYRSAVITTRDGKRLDGVIRNEDNFSVQLQTRDGDFHLFRKSELQNLEYAKNSLMPTNYGERLSKGEIDDLVRFLISAAPDAGKVAPVHKKEYEDE